MQSQISQIDEFDLLVLGHLLYATSPEAPEFAASSSSITAYLPFDHMTFRERLERLEGPPFYFAKVAYEEYLEEVPEPYYWLTYRGFAYVRRNIDHIAKAVGKIAAPPEVLSTLSDFKQFNVNGVRSFGRQKQAKRQKVPASDRYVNVRDNQSSFDELSEQLTRIKNEYERDHNHLGAEPATVDLLSEVDAALAQIQRGRVRLGQLVDGLLPTFEQSCLALAAYPGMVLAIEHAMTAAQDILRLFGLL